MPKKSKKTAMLNMPVTAKPENYFILVTGVPLKNLKELASSLEHMNEWVYTHHVNSSRNDFASWAKEVLMEEELSEEIRHCSNNKEMEYKIMRHLINRYL